MGKLPDSEGFIGLSVPGADKFIIKSFVGKGCNALVFHGYYSSIGSSVAYKVIPKSRLAPGELWISEPKKANILADSCVVKCHHHYDWPEKDCIVLEYDYIEGESLSSFIKNHPSEVNIDFIVDFLKTALTLFYELKERKMEHGDFHSGNVLVCAPSRFQLSSSAKFKITDFGTGRLTGESPVLDDYDGLAKIVSELLFKVDYQAISAKEKFIFNQLNDCIAGKHLLEKDSTLDPLARNPEELIKRINQIENEYITHLNGKRSAILVTPFDYLSCEQIGSSSSILKALYSDKFLGLSEIEAANNVVVTGPRGCGKSTIFRSLTAKHRLHLNEFDILEDTYIGIYYHCNDLYYKFPRYKFLESDSLIDIPMQYVTCRILIEVIETVQQINGSASTDYEMGLVNELWSLLDIKKPSVPSANTFNQLIGRLGEECQKVVRRARFGHDSSDEVHQYAKPDTLINACELILKRISTLHNKKFHFLIDDYSAPHITIDLQRNLNRLFMTRNATCFFKLSTESPVSFAASDVDGKNYVEGREYELLNLGLKFVREDSDRKKEFLEDIFKRRLEAVKNYPAKSILELVGDGAKESQNGIAEQIANNVKMVWHGSDTLSNLCSGDIHSMISIVKMMVESIGGKDHLDKVVPMIPIKSQNEVIRKNAGSFLHNLSNTGSKGQNLVNIVTAFANVAASHLKFRKSKNETGNPHHQASRIEINEWPEMDEETRDLYNELLRYSVFIEDPRGKSIRGAVVPRLYLRRFLVPHFNLTFSLRDSIRMNPNDFQMLLKNPGEYEQKNRLKKDAVVFDTGFNQSFFDFEGK